MYPHDLCSFPGACLSLLVCVAGCSQAAPSELGSSDGEPRAGMGGSNPNSAAGGGAPAKSPTKNGAETICGSVGSCRKEGTRNPADWPFDECSPFNHPMGSDAEYADIEPSPEFQPEWSTFGSWVRNWTTFGCLSIGDNSIVRAGEQPAHQGQVRNGTGTKAFDFLLPDVLPVPTEVDRHMYVIDEDDTRVVETFHAEAVKGDIVASWILDGSLTDSGLADGEDGCAHRGTRAYGGSALAGLIRKGELRNGIHHALAIKIPEKALNAVTPNGRGYVWPASCRDGNYSGYGDSGNVHMGTRLAIPPSADLSDIDNPLVKSMAIALRDYGAIVVDRGSGGPIDDPNSFPGCISYMAELGDDDAASIHKAREQLGRMTTQLRVVTNASPERVGGGGTPLTCFAPAWR